MKQQSDWMKGLLWAENYIQQGVFFEGDETGVKSLQWEIDNCFDYDLKFLDYYNGAVDYLEYYKEMLL